MTEAKKSAKARAAGKKSSRGKPSPEDRLIDAALSLAAERGWRRLSLAEIGEEAGLSLVELHALAPSKTAILDLFTRRIDTAVLAEGRLSEEEGPARDRLFGVLMRRFDAMQPYRAGLAEILYDSGRDPLGVALSLPRLACSMSWMLEAAGLDSQGVRGLLRIKALSAAYLVALRSWLKDDSDDLSATMATLDWQLRRLDGLARCFTKRRGQEDTSAAQASQA